MKQTRMGAEIGEQPAILESRAGRWSEQAEEVRARLGEPATPVVVGRGSSGNACTFMTYLYGLRTGRHPIEFRPFLARAGAPRADWSDAVVYAFSVSGESSDVGNAARWLRERGARVVAVTNAEGDCRLVELADAVVRLGVGPERAVPATKTLCAELFVAAALCGFSIEEPARETAAALRALLAGGEGRRLASFLDGARTAAFVARGPALAAALDAALKLQETAAIPAMAYSAAELLHGPIGSLGVDDRAVLFEDSGGAAESGRAVALALLAREVPFVVAGAEPESESGDAGARVTLPIPLPAERWARAPVFALLSQVCALEAALARGLDPDAPRGLQKVTLTT